MIKNESRERTHSGFVVIWKRKNYFATAAYYYTYDSCFQTKWSKKKNDKIPWSELDGWTVKDTWYFIFYIFLLFGSQCNSVHTFIPFLQLLKKLNSEKTQNKLGTLTKKLLFFKWDFLCHVCNVCMSIHCPSKNMKRYKRSGSYTYSDILTILLCDIFLHFLEKVDADEKRQRVYSWKCIMCVFRIYAHLLPFCVYLHMLLLLWIGTSA